MKPTAASARVRRAVRGGAWFSFVLAATLHAGEPRMEKRVLFDGSSAKTWNADEATMTSSDDLVKNGAGPSLHWHVAVDYFAGELKYPVGWPRVSHALKGDDCDWRAWDYFHFWIHARTSRAALPRVPAVLNILQGQGRSSPHTRILSDLKKDGWLEVTIPTSALPLAGDVRMLQFNIAEDQYHHQDTLDFHIADLALLRHAEPALVDFAPVNAVVFDDARVVPASFTLAGVKPGGHRRVTLRLRREGAVVAEQSFEAARGAQRLALDVSKAPLKAGGHELEGSVEGGGATALAKVRVIGSPWSR